MSTADIKTHVARIIAQSLDCDKLCQSQPSGCGCSEVAADAVLIYLASLQAGALALPNGHRGGEG